MIVFPNAKINLGLNVVERRTDGYHNLETVFYPIPLEDILEANEAEEFSLCLSGIPLEGDAENNLVAKAYRLLKEEFPELPPVRVNLHKHIPSGAGLGGGSADASYMLRLLREMFSLPLDDDALEERAARLGADCAFFVRNQPTFATGTGNIFTPLPGLSLKGYCIVVVKPNIFVSTREAFALVRPHRPERKLTDIVGLPVNQWLEAGMCNDFEESVFAQYPAIKAIKEQLYALGAEYASMSGSGSAVFGLWPSESCPDLELLKRTFPECFCWRS